MLEALVITLREGLEAALVVGIVFAYLARTGRSAWQRYVWFGLIAALFASIGGAALFQVFGIDPENEIYEGTIMLVAKLIANGLHEFLEIKLLPSTPELMSIIGLLTRETTSLVILIALIALPALLILWDTWRAPRPASSWAACSSAPS